MQENENQNNQNDQYQEITDPYSTSTYILKYKRNEEELKELSFETNLPKSENCLFMLNIKILKSDMSEGSPDSSMDIDKEKDEFLVICCHEIVTIYLMKYMKEYTL